MKKNKFKTRQSIARRFKITKTGKIIRRSSFSRHLRSKKSKAQIRQLKRPKQLKGNIAKKIRKLMGARKESSREGKNRTIPKKKA